MRRPKGGKGRGLALEEACTLPGGQARKDGGHEKPCNLQPAGEQTDFSTRVGMGTSGQDT